MDGFIDLKNKTQLQIKALDIWVSHCWWTQFSVSILRIVEPSEEEEIGTVFSSSTSHWVMLLTLILKDEWGRNIHYSMLQRLHPICLIVCSQKKKWHSYCIGQKGSCSRRKRSSPIFTGEPNWAVYLPALTNMGHRLEVTFGWCLQHQVTACSMLWMRPIPAVCSIMAANEAVANKPWAFAWHSLSCGSVWL